MRATVKAETSGPFFTKDPRKTFRENARVMLQGVADEGEARVRSNVNFPLGPEPHHISQGIVGRVESLRGKPWALTAVVSVPEARKGGVFHAYGSRLERKYRWFRRGIGGIRKQRREAEKLLRGLQ